MGFLVFFIGMWVFIQVITLILMTSRNRERLALTEFPQVSILVAARNEAENLPRCLDALLALDYPQEAYSIYVGDDDSTDDTAAIVRQYAAQHPKIHLVSIKGLMGKARGKANVLAQLFHQSDPDFYAIVDADVRVGAPWLSGMIKEAGKDYDLVSGCTGVEGSPIQQMEWMQAFGFIGALSVLEVPVSAVGNNMIIRKKAYWYTGGYEQIPFSLTEDKALFDAMRKGGYHWRNVIGAHVMAYTLPVKGFKALMTQRRRWMTGALSLALFPRTALFLQALWPFLILVGLFINTPYALVLLAGCTFLQVYQLVQVYLRCRLSWIDWLWLPFYLPYSWGMGVIMSFNYLLSRRVTWKGRQYQYKLND
jgi:cellulose synthase/poly-beta-1,6-N-acetylglucosamine synthase-like glycosyltransferase